MAFDHWRFRLTSDLLEIRSGIWWKTVQILPLPKLQHADIRRGPIERQYGLATLIVYTAGTHSAVLVVPGLDKSEASQLRDKLVMESTRDEL